MRFTPLFLPAALSLTMLVTVAASGPRLATRPNHGRPVDEAAREVSRIRAHFDSVIAELETRDSDALTAAQRARRSALIETLRTYRHRGLFPHNYDFGDRAMPYFVDRETGVHCAVAHLLASTGRADIVERVARADNNVWVAALAADSAFTNWLDENGLTLAEAARIQVPYVNNVVTPAQQARNKAFFVVAPAALGGAVVSSLWNGFGNADGHRRAVNVLGVVSGVVSIGIGASLVAKSDLPPSIGIANAAIGGLSVALSTRSIRHRRAIAARSDDAARQRAPAEATIAPTIPIGSTGAGVGVSVRF